LSINLCFAAHPLNARAESQGRNFQNQSVTRGDGPPKTRFSDPSEKHQLLIAIGNFAQRQDSAALRQRLNYQDARHYRRTGKVALKERFVNADLFDPDDALERRQFDDPIDQQEGIAMRKKLLNAFGIENRFHEFPKLAKGEFSDHTDMSDTSLKSELYLSERHFGVVTDAVTGFLML
jgi:hypothetical protein